MGLEHLSRLTKPNSTATKQIALYAAMMTVFLSLSSPNTSLLQAPAVSVHFLPRSIFPVSPSFLGWLAGYVVLSQGCNCISSLKGKKEVQSVFLSLKVVIWIPFLYTTTLAIKCAETVWFRAPLALPSSSVKRFTGHITMHDTYL